MANQHLFCFGLGLTASTLAKSLPEKKWHITGTHRVPSTKKPEQSNLTLITYVTNITLPKSITHILLSIPPNTAGDLIYQHYYNQIKELPKLEWIGYLSTTGVYGNHDGNWVTEETPPTPITGPAQNRVIAEAQWLESDLPVHIFRLAGIYGPNRSALEQLQKGKARRIDKKGQVFSRIHVEDIAQIITASINNPSPKEIYNCADDLPESQEKVISYAAKLLNITPPPLIPYEQAQLSPMAQNFYSCNRRVSNKKIKEKLGVTLKYPDYKAGLTSLHTKK